MPTNKFAQQASLSEKMLRLADKGGIKVNVLKNGEYVESSRNDRLAWAKYATDDEPYEPDPECMIYTLQLIPESTELLERKGVVSVETEEWIKRNGTDCFGLTFFYHGGREPAYLGDDEKRMLWNVQILPDIEDAIHYDTPGTKGCFPVLDTDDEAVRRMQEEGKLSIIRNPKARNGRIAVATIPDDAFLYVSRMCFARYVNSTLCTMLRKIAIEDMPLESMGDEMGEKELRHVSDDMHTLADYAVKTMRVIIDTGGAALLDRDVITPEEKERFHSVCAQHRLDVDTDMLSKYFTPVSNVLKVAIGEGTQRREYNAANLANFLNSYQPMKEARKANGFPEFSPEELLGVMQKALDTRRERKFSNPINRPEPD